MNIFKLGLAIFTWSLDEILAPIAHKKVKNKLYKHAPSDPYLTRRLIKKFDPPKTIPIPRIKEQAPLQHRKPVKITSLKLPYDSWVKGEYFIEEHQAGHLHHDFSIVVNGKVYRLARTPSVSNKKQGFLGIFPGPGDKVSWIPQPEHYVKEVPNPPIITEGYGKGTTKVIKHGYCFANTSRNNNLHVMFEGIEGVYVFVENTPNTTLMMRKQHPSPWLGKHIMRESRDIQHYINDSNYYFFAKKNGAAIEWKIVKTPHGKRLQIWSWRPDALTEKKYGIRQQIEHTFRLPICDKPIPDNIPISAGRGELWCGGKDGLHHVGSILNSNQARARTSKWHPYLYIHDILEWNGKDIKHQSYRKKLDLMQQMHDIDHRFKIPEHATTPKGKKALWDKCHKEWPVVDGVIAWPMDMPGESLLGRGVKLKFKHVESNWHPGTIVDIVPQRGEHGERFGYPIVENKYGIRFKSSGVGITEAVKEDMLKNPEEWIGVSVRYSAERHFGDGTPFQPVIKDMATE